MSPYLTTREAAAYLSLSPTTLRHWRATGAGPKYVRLGRSIRYTTAELDRFASEHTFASEQEEAERNG